MGDGPESATDGHVASGWFVVRVPLLAFDELEAWDRARSSPGPRVPAALTRPEVREAVFVASRGLDDRMGSTATPDDAGERAGNALIRYFLRMTSRPTPFGLFATCSLGAVGDRTRLPVAPASAVRRRTRLDAGYLAALSEALDAEVSRSAVLRPNPTLFSVGDRIRYVEQRVDAQGARDFHLVSAHAGDPLLVVLAAAATGATLEQLTEVLVDEGHAAEDARPFLAELADAQILLGGIEPPVTGEDGLAALIHGLAEDDPSRHTLVGVAEALAAIDADGTGRPPAVYEEVAALLEGLPAPVDRARLFQVDAIRPADPSGGREAVLGPEVIAALREAIDVLYLVGRPWSDAALERFRRRFSERFGQRWVPLLVALDEETGVGYLPGGESVTEPAPLLDGLAATRRRPDPMVGWRLREQRLLELLHGAWMTGAAEIELDDSDVAALSYPDAPPLPDAFAAMCTIAGSSDEANASGDFSIHLSGAFGPSGARLVARFCDVDDAIDAAVRAHLRAEEALVPDAAFAEVVYRPRGRLGNVIDRPVLRRWEIPIVGRSGAPDGQVIALGDLLVTVSDGAVRLRSVSLDQEVLPRMSTAHDYYARGNLGVYSFLCALQSESSVGSLRWSWEPLDGGPFLPRVRHGRVVLSRAQWVLDGSELGRLFDPGDDAPLHERVQRLRAVRRLPRFVHIAGPDAELLTDLDNPLAVEAAFATVKGRPTATLIEMYPGPDELVARGPGGRYVHELVVPFQRTAPLSVRTPMPPPTPSGPRRDFPPGSEWLHLEIYSDRSVADRLLLDPIAELVTACVGDGAAEQWFFIRYADPDPHLRLRFGGDPEALQLRCRPVVEAALGREFDRGRVRAVKADVYRREVERYGGPEGVRIAESMFQVDSEAVLALLPHIVGDAGAVRRWQTALLVIDRTLAVLGFDLDHRRRLVVGMRASLEHEFDVGPAGRVEIGARLRPHRARLVGLLEGTDDSGTEMEAITAILADRTDRLRPHADALRRLAAGGTLATPLDSVAWSVVHMSLNRLLRGAHRRQELVLTSYLDRLYDSLTARRREH